MDIKSAKARSENMRQILSKNTSPEVFLRKALLPEDCDIDYTLERFGVNPISFS